jgi:hypothetical protein
MISLMMMVPFMLPVIEIGVPAFVVAVSVAVSC